MIKLEYNKEMDASLKDFAQRIANKEVGLRWVDQSRFYTDGETIYLSTEVQNDYNAITGLLSHEAGHIGYGSFSIDAKALAATWKENNVQLIQEIANVTEDPRVDKILSIEWPGAYDGMVNYINNSGVNERFIKNIEETKNILGYIYMFLNDEKGFDKKPDIVPITDAEWKVIGDMKEILLKELSTAASILAMKNIHNIVKKYIPENNRNNQKSMREMLGDNMIRHPHQNRSTNYDKARENQEAAQTNQKVAEELEKIEEELKKQAKGKAKGKGQIDPKNIKLGDGEGEGEPVARIDLGMNVPGKNDYNPNGEPDIPLIELDQATKERLIKELLEKSKEQVEKAIAETKEIKKRPKPELTCGRKVNTHKIEEFRTCSETRAHSLVLKENAATIKRLKVKFKDLKNKSGMDNSQRRGRLNSKLIRAVTSNYTYDRIYSRKIRDKELRLLVMVDVSGSMSGDKISMAKEALVILAESLQGIADVKIVLFNGSYEAYNTVLKDWKENITANKTDRMRSGRSNLDGVSIAYEAKDLNPDDYIIVISDGQPAGSGYGITEAIEDLKPVKMKHKIFAFSIYANGSYLEKMYGNNYCIVNKRKELAPKLLTAAERIIREFKHK